ncbi:MAG TPA: hypothetical protein VGN83_13690 [Falsiroseomonas sp.]|jgi:hypothetical protein|nr:hypothetical protein [Falsiroseomonas sp.]
MDTPQCHGTRRFITCTDSVAAARSMVVFDTLRASTRTVLLDQAVASSSGNRLAVASEALSRLLRALANP